MFYLSHYYLTLEKNLAQIKLSILLPKDALCRAWLKFDQGFLRRMFLKLSMNFHYWMNRLTDSEQTDRQIDIKMQIFLIRKAKLKTSFKPNQNAQFIQNITVTLLGITSEVVSIQAHMDISAEGLRYLCLSPSAEISWSKTTLGPSSCLVWPKYKYHGWYALIGIWYTCLSLI